MQERPPLVLIVNNDAALRDALQFVLRLEGTEVHLHHDGAMLMQDVDLHRADCLIVTERMLPMNGFEVLKCLQEKQIRLPVILLTNDASAALRARATAAGVQVVLENPILDDALVEAVLALLL